MKPHLAHFRAFPTFLNKMMGKFVFRSQFCVNSRKVSCHWGTPLILVLFKPSHVAWMELVIFNTKNKMMLNFTKIQTKITTKRLKFLFYLNFNTFTLDLAIFKTKVKMMLNFTKIQTKITTKRLKFLFNLNFRTFTLDLETKECLGQSIQF